MPAPASEYLADLEARIDAEQEAAGRLFGAAY